MVLGMSVVFAFLFFLVQIISIQKCLLEWLLEPKTVIGEMEEEGEIVAAIVSAIKLHRKKEKQHE